MADSKISDLTATSAAAGANEIPINEAGTTKKITLTQVDTLFGITGGWISLGACTYEGADAPTYTFSLASDMTTTLQAGMRIKLTDAAAVKYFIITSVGSYSGGKTIITVFGGTDYTLSGGEITLPYYSTQKTPLGFPGDPSKWSVTLTDSTLRTQASPTSATYYNLGSLSIDIPIGIWYVSFSATFRADASSGIQLWSALSTSTSSTSDMDLVSYFYTSALAGLSATSFKSKMLILAVKDTYYPIFKVTASGITNLYAMNATARLDVNAVCAYL